MRIYKGNPELVFRGRVAPWYGALAGIVSFAAAALALQPGMPVGVPVLVLVAGALILWPVVVRNRVELYRDRLEIVFGWARTIIPYDHVRGVRRFSGPALNMNDFTAHANAASLEGVFIEAPVDGDAAVSVIGNENLVSELCRRAGIDAGDAGVPPRPEDAE